jgi:hypothetical protein
MDIYREAVETFGTKNQYKKLCEEVAELNLAFQRFNFNPSTETLNNVLEEIADVKIMLMQADYLFDGCEIEKQEAIKLNRLESRIKEEKELQNIKNKTQ